MSHLIRTAGVRTYSALIDELRAAHSHLVECATSALSEFHHSSTDWGARFKRLYVSLGASRPSAIEKERERLVEIINMVATLERLIAGVSWFSSNPQTVDLIVLECHPSTSASDTGNDLVLGHTPNDRRVLIEVTDVASGSAGQNGKERKDLASLGCATAVPSDGVRRFLCTSPEFAGALTNVRRRWDRSHYRYSLISIVGSDTRLLEVVAAPAAPQLTRGTKF